ncbi:solute carrier organic anion transporter family member 4C1 [Aplysia californica]|uniref:Solute carrier organic anion transporter family member n=1 Tax=Aplysia californica TaxID=6500 RepID=A0ABM1VQ75_APLCA|nr:solute carrier organic anion transporter family member 4C1 [Aplysia californica]
MEEGQKVAESAPPSFSVTPAEDEAVQSENQPVSESVDEEDCETRCGYWGWRPNFLQSVNKPGFLVFFVAMYSMMLGFVVNGVNNVNVSSIERRFDLQSANVGFLASSYDISAAVLAVVIGYYGSGKRKARMISVAVFASALGSFVMTVPHFATGQYSLGISADKICVDETSSNSSCSATRSNPRLGNYFYVFLLGQLLHGIGGTTMLTVGISLIDDSVMPKKTPLYLGFVYGCNILGSGLGYIVGGQLLNVYVDFDTVDHVELTPSDTRWLGAWWLAPGIAAALQLVVSIPLSLFGAELPTSKEVRRKRISQAHQGQPSAAASTSVPLPTKLKELRAVWIVFTLLRNPCFVFITLGMTVEGMFLSGIAAFLPKFVENEYGISASRAAIVSGLAIIPAAAGGLLLGGYIAKRFNLNITQAIKFIILTSVLAALGSSVIWIRCKPLEIYGVSRPYHGRDKGQLPISLGAPCNNMCSCDTDLFEPVCNNETGVYFSPCYAGCTEQTGPNVFSHCACVSAISRPGNQSSVSQQLSSENCRQPCNMLYLFISLLFFSMCLSFMPIAPGDSIQLRCVEEEHKTFAQGIKMLIVRMLGSFVGPILVGKLLDLNCDTWRERCGQRLSCWLYDHDTLVICIYLFIVTCKGLSILFCCLALKFYQPPKPPVVEQVASPQQEMGNVAGHCMPYGDGHSAAGDDEEPDFSVEDDGSSRTLVRFAP